MSSIGTALKEARSRKAVTLEEVHSKIKIHPRILGLLEEDKFDKLPGPLFVKSFLKSYADFLEINSEELVEAYEKEGKKDAEQVLYIPTASEKEKAASFNRNIWIPAGAVLIAAISLVSVFFVVKTIGGWVERAKAAASHKKTVAAVVSARAVESPSVPKEPEAKTATAKPAVAAGPEVQWLRSVELGNFPKLSRRSGLELELKALDSVWLRMTCDGKVLFQSILKKGDAETWKADRTIEIWTGNASNMQLSLNGHSLGSPGKGVIRRLFIDHDGVRIIPS